MDTTAVASLVNFGAAGAVILVVILFLKYIKERDAEWRAFFTALNQTNVKDILRISESQERVVQQLTALQDSLRLHDSHVDKRIAESAQILANIVKPPVRKSRRTE